MELLSFMPNTASRQRLSVKIKVARAQWRKRVRLMDRRVDHLSGRYSLWALDAQSCDETIHDETRRPAVMHSGCKVAS